MQRFSTGIKRTTQLRPFHTHFRVRIILIFEDPTVTVNSIPAIQALFLYFNLCLSISVGQISHVHLHPYPFFLIYCKYKMNMHQLIMINNTLGVVVGYSRKITHWFYRDFSQKAQMNLKTYLICPQIECMHNI